jgi:hypothetical protein
MSVVSLRQETPRHQRGRSRAGRDTSVWSTMMKYVPAGLKTRNPRPASAEPRKSRPSFRRCNKGRHLGVAPSSRSRRHRAAPENTAQNVRNWCAARTALVNSGAGHGPSDLPTRQAVGLSQAGERVTVRSAMPGNVARCRCGRSASNTSRSYTRRSPRLRCASDRVPRSAKAPRVCNTLPGRVVRSIDHKTRRVHG